ncbi:MAG: Rpn family recombination-promoting nuclease/putative transposase [Jaaginema sp. PMC 1079.18]|nr:Rpn family recombination-promoting nuclease/putative transposase [Jaaginema sp. PMC 1080.18]MEC4849762.1 Rpn family recombination-promoting nuclease/putative transposase [Jaaginema sp. PMC 1079.18]MEC4866626.1 Rpn family recombination-promoting nuclease/putative transposase [Jaaginema sp. PMC 1078.18]
MKTDTLFYEIFQNFPRIFFELIDCDPELANEYQFVSQEFKQVAFRVDGLCVPLDANSHRPFYLIEVQFQSDETFYYRLLGELFLYLKQYNSSLPWQVVVIYPTRSCERIPSEQIMGILSLDWVTRIYLDELDEEANSRLGVGIVKLIVESEAEAVTQARRLIVLTKEQLRDRDSQNALIDLIETIIIYKLPQKSWEEIKAMLGLDELKNTRVYQDGRAEGRQEGRQEAKTEMIIAFFQQGLSISQIAKAAKLSVAEVQAILDNSST